MHSTLECTDRTLDSRTCGSVAGIKPKRVDISVHSIFGVAAGSILGTILEAALQRNLLLCIESGNIEPALDRIGCDPSDKQDNAEDSGSDTANLAPVRRLECTLEFRRIRESFFTRKRECFAQSLPLNPGE